MAALKAISVAVSAPTTGQHQTSIAGSAAADIAAIIANTATLVADGASPTQAHVNTLNGNVTALNAVVTGSATLIVDQTKITTQRQLLAVLDALRVASMGGYFGSLTA